MSEQPQEEQVLVQDCVCPKCCGATQRHHLVCVTHFSSAGVIVASLFVFGAAALWFWSTEEINQLPEEEYPRAQNVAADVGAGVGLIATGVISVCFAIAVSVGSCGIPMHEAILDLCPAHQKVMVFASIAGFVQIILMATTCWAIAQVGYTRQAFEALPGVKSDADAQLVIATLGSAQGLAGLGAALQVICAIVQIIASSAFATEMLTAADPPPGAVVVSKAELEAIEAAAAAEEAREKAAQAETERIELKEFERQHSVEEWGAATTPRGHLR